MERLTREDRACAIAAATLAHACNDELTVILSGAFEAMLALEPGHPARPRLREVETAARRCARKCYVALAFAARKGVKAGRAPLEAVLGV